MSFLFVAIPVIIVVVGVSLAFVFLSDSKKHVSRMDTEQQNNLEKMRQEALQEVDKLKSRSNKSIHSADSEVVDVNEVNKKIEDQSEEIERLKKELAKLKSSKTTDSNLGIANINLSDNSTSQLVFSRENIVRGLITKEYLPRKNRR